MNDRIEIYHRPFDAAFNQTTFSREDHLHLAALNRQTQARYHAYAQQPIQTHTSEIHEYLTHWRSTAFSSARILHNGTIRIQNHDIDSLPPTGPTFPELPRFGQQQENFKLRLALYQAIERDALQRIEQLDPCPGTQLLRLFWTIPQDRMLSFDSLEDPPLPKRLDTLAGHCLRADDQELLLSRLGQPRRRPRRSLNEFHRRADPALEPNRGPPRRPPPRPRFLGLERRPHPMGPHRPPGLSRLPTLIQTWRCDENPRDLPHIIRTNPHQGPADRGQLPEAHPDRRPPRRPSGIRTGTSPIQRCHSSPQHRDQRRSRRYPERTRPN